MSGTDIAYGAPDEGRGSPHLEVQSAICLRTCYAMSCTDIAVLAAIAMCGTEIAHGATRGAVLRAYGATRWA
eukprot:3094138-Rhodomonas_salina.1